jgi:hypothetical protein
MVSLLAPCKAGGIVECVAVGIAAVRVKMVNPCHRYATADLLGGTGRTDRLRSADCGLEILAVSDIDYDECCPSANDKWCYVRFGVATDEFWGRITSVEPDCPSGPYSVLDYTFEEVRKEGSLGGGWVAVTGGWTGACFNGVEMAGAPLADPPRVGAVVKMRMVYQASIGVEFWFQWEGPLECV